MLTWLIKIIAFSLLLLCAHCRQKEHPQLPVQQEVVQAKPFFDFTHLIHYNSQVHESDLYPIFEQENPSSSDSLKVEVLLRKALSEMQDTVLLPTLTGIGFREQAVPQHKHQPVSEVFSDKGLETTTSKTCMHVYRDILVFKLQDKTVGLAKICFRCHDHYIAGARASTRGFGEAGEYQKLETILKNE